jgi:2-keto-3-deoxy-L-rhamnonate aldolase RhmA
MTLQERIMTLSLNAGRKLKQKLRAGETVLGLWITQESLAISEIAAHIGLDWVCIDAEHGHLDFKEVLSHLVALNGSSTAALVRIQETEEGLIKRFLDLGAHGILVPQVRTASDVGRAVAFAKYPPQGVRGIGAERATLWGKALLHVRTANDDTLVIPMIESVEAGKNLEDILNVPHIDAFYFGPADFSASAGYAGEWEGPGVAEQILEIKTRLRTRGFACGISATGIENGRMRMEQGFQMISLGSDCGLLIRALTEMLNGLGRTVTPGVWNA